MTILDAHLLMNEATDFPAVPFLGIHPWFTAGAGTLIVIDHLAGGITAGLDWPYHPAERNKPRGKKSIKNKIMRRGE